MTKPSVRELRLSFRPDGPLDLAATLGMLRLGHQDPCQVRVGEVTCLAVSDQVTIAFEQADGQISAHLFGDNNIHWAAEWVPHLLGLQFQTPDLEGPRRLRELAYQHRGFRLPRAMVLFPSLVRTILQQLVSHHDACHAWKQLVKQHGSDAPGPYPLRAAPTPATFARLSIDDFVACSILPQQGRRLRQVAKLASRIEAIWSRASTNASRTQTCDLLSQIPGIGPWTLGFLRGAAMQDADATVPGDYSFPHQIAYFFEGRHRGNDEEMLARLEPFRPHRFYVLALILKSGIRPPRRGPRREALRDHLRRAGLRRPSGGGGPHW